MTSGIERVNDLIQYNLLTRERVTENDDDDDDRADSNNADNTSQVREDKNFISFYFKTIFFYDAAPSTTHHTSSNETTTIGTQPRSTTPQNVPDEPAPDVVIVPLTGTKSMTVPDLRIRVARLVASKITLAARVVSFDGSSKGEQGKQLLADTERRLEKLQEPPPLKAIKSLAPPIDSRRKKHGERKQRKMRERLGMTQLCTQTNQMKFGEIEEDVYQDAIGFSSGLIGKSGFGKVLTAQADSKTKVKIFQELQKILQCQKNIHGVTITKDNRKYSFSFTQIGSLVT